LKKQFKNIVNLLFKTPVIIGVLMFFASCENDIKKVQELTAKQDSAIVSARSIEMYYTTNGINNILMKAPLLNRYVQDKGKSQLEFPEGMDLTFYNQEGSITSTIRADYSIYYEDEGRWIAKFNVVATNERGETLNTEYLIWLQNEKKIMSDQFVKINTADGIFYGDGFESDQTFSSWELVNMRGTINIQENE